MWFVFPQIAGLGSSAMARRYALASSAEATAYLVHPTLGPRLVELTEAVLRHGGRRTAEAIFGPVDAMKFRSSMTLFAAVAPHADVFEEAVETFFAGRPDPATLARLE